MVFSGLASTNPVTYFSLEEEALFFDIRHSSFCQFQANPNFEHFFSLQLVHWWWKMHYHCIWKGDFHNNHRQRDTGGRGLPNSKEVKKLNKLEWINGVQGGKEGSKFSKILFK